MLRVIRLYSHVMRDMTCCTTSSYRALFLSSSGLKELIIENSWYAALPCICVQNSWYAALPCICVQNSWYAALPYICVQNSWYAALPCICVQNPKLLKRSNMLLSSAENCSVLLKLRMSKTVRDWFISSALHTLHLTTTRRSKGMVLIRFIMYRYGRFRH